MANRNKFYGYLAACISAFFWGMSFVGSKSLLNAQFPVFTIVTLRVIVASIVLLLVFGLQHKIEKIQKKDIGMFFMLSFLEPYLYFIGENYGLKFVSPSFASIMIAFIPICTALTLHFVEKHILRAELIIGTIISILGVVILSTYGSKGEISIKGFLLLVLAVASAVSYGLVLARLLAKGYGPVSITTWQNLLSIVFYIPTTAIIDHNQWAGLNWSVNTIGAIIFLGVFCSAIAYMMYSIAANEITIEKTSVFTNAIPVVTITFSVLIGQEVFNVQKLCGVVIVVIGVILSQSKLFANFEIKPKQ